MTTTEPAGVYYDPYDPEINADPYPTFARLRDEAPVYLNERYGFWALSRHADVEQRRGDRAQPGADVQHAVAPPDAGGRDESLSPDRVEKVQAPRP